MKTVRFEDYERDLEARKNALGITGTNYVAPNSGTRRTQAKRRLLRKIAEMAEQQGRSTPFKANY